MVFGYRLRTKIVHHPLLNIGLIIVLYASKYIVCYWQVVAIVHSNDEKKFSMQHRLLARSQSELVKLFSGNSWVGKVRNAPNKKPEP